MPPPPRSLPEELVEEILLRFPPNDPARLVHAALVCKPWRAIVSGAGFRRRVAEFVPICSLPVSKVHSRWRGHVVDAHHGRILLQIIYGPAVLRCPSDLVVWDPTRGVQKRVPFPAAARYMPGWTAAVLCAAGGPCDHLDCRRQGPFLIVFVGYGGDPYADDPHSETVLCTYSSSTASWSKPMSSNLLPHDDDDDDDYMFTHAAHVKNALYFGVLMTDHILKFDLESQEISWIQTPPATCSSEWPYVLTTTEGGRLGLATIHDFSKLLMWSRNDVSQVDATWAQSTVIELRTLLPVHAVLAWPRLLGFTVGTGVIFVTSSNDVLFMIDLKTYKVIKELSISKGSNIDTINFLT
ncbi:hypothetical protein SORBI_3002G014300 [Sorghum bicolor]|uniref:F-box domain-containing protein n=1 Tax=Sorghum bicolor TaxID=4558 RepID=A0A1W0W1V4_SORBI|nr:hypothetical protein SORBI_3002G014300 [Sorghum bicolor]